MDFTVLLQGLRHSTEFMNYKTIESAQFVSNIKNSQIQGDTKCDYTCMSEWEVSFVLSKNGSTVENFSVSDN